MPLWAWILVVVGGVGALGALAICAAVYEITWLKSFRKWDALP
jgi:hypothetical protein